MPGLRLTGGNGLQGLFAVHSHYVPHSDYYTDCRGDFPGSVEKCNARLEQSQETVKLAYRSDPLKTKYEGMPIPAFLKEVKIVADSLGDSGQVPAANR